MDLKLNYSSKISAKHLFWKSRFWFLPRIWLGWMKKYDISFIPKLVLILENTPDLNFLQYEFLNLDNFDHPKVNLHNFLKKKKKSISDLTGV